MVKWIIDQKCPHDATTPASARHPDDGGGEKSNAHDGLNNFSQIAITRADNAKEYRQPDAIGDQQGQTDEANKRI